MSSAGSNRWFRDLTDREIKLVMDDPNKEIVEWPVGCLTFIMSRKYIAIIRTSLMGGDTQYSIDGGWKYPHDIAYMLDRREILILPERVWVKK